MSKIIKFAMVLAIAVYAANVTSKSIYALDRLFRAAHPDLSTSVDELQTECRDSAEWSGSETAPSAECVNSIRQLIENIETRGIIAWRMTSNDTFLICTSELKALSDRELVNWFETEVVPQALGAGDIYPAELASFIVLDEKNRCIDR